MKLLKTQVSVILLILFFLPALGYTQKTGNCPGGITSYWLFDEQGGAFFSDSVGGLDADCTGESCPVPVPGRIEDGISFDGINDGLFVSSDISLNWGASDSFSVEFWMKTDPSSTCAGNQVIAGRNENNFRWWIGCSDNTGSATFRLRDKTGAGPTDPVFGITDLTDGKWHHVVAVRDGLEGVTKIYVDGLLEASQSYSYQAGFDSPAALLSIGWMDLNPYYFFAGSIDEMAIYHRALDDTEIAQHYHDGAVGLRWGYCGCGIPVRIMPLGDSITRGNNNTVTDNNYIVGYRQKLYLDLFDAGYEVDFVGSQQSGLSALPDFDIDHEGYPGYHASDSVSGDILESVFDALLVNPADAVLLHIGTNDISTGGQNVSEVSAVLDEIDRYSPDIMVVLALIINRTDSPALSHATTQFNDEVEAMTAERVSRGDKILLVDQENALDYTTDMSMSGIHPNDNGYRKMAAAWFKGLGEVLPFCARTPRIISVPVTTGTVGQVYTYDVDAIGYPTSTYSLVSVHSGMTIDTITGLITWVPSLSGVFDVTVAVSNVNGSSSQSFSITIGENSAVKIWLEAEGGRLTEPVVAAQDNQASTNGYIWVVDGRGDVFDSTKAVGQVRFDFTAPVAGNYVIWGRVIANNDSNNSFFVSLDDGDITAWEVAVATTWMWDQINVKNGVDPLVFSLTAGQHSLVIKQREDGTKLDRLLITNDMRYMPQGAGDPVITSIPVTGGAMNQQYTYDVEATGTPAPIYRLVVFPQGMSIDEQTGLIRWTPFVAGNYAVTIMAENSGGGSFQHFMITVSGTYTITATAGTGGNISPSGSVTVNHGANQTFTITANTGYQIVDVKVNGTSVGAVSTYAFSNVKTNHTIAATFATATVPDIAVSSSLNLGDIKVGKSSSRNLSINNKGNGDLLIKNVEIVGTSSTMFSTNFAGPKTVSPLRAYSLTVIFMPTSKGEKSATMRIYSNDPDTPVAEVLLSGKGK